jgi:3-dehydroquinate dehydratase/shikimate dehydrogenase
VARLTQAHGPPGWRARVVAVLAAPAELTSMRLESLNATVDELEVRADLVGDPDPRWLRRHFTGTLTYHLPTASQAGCFRVGSAARHARLLGAAAHYDLIDLECTEDLVSTLLAAVPPHRRRISWHGPPADPAGLRERFAQMAATPAALYLLAPQATSAETALAPLLLLAMLGRADVTAFATGPAGTWSRILAPWLGAPVVFGGPATPATDGTPSLEQLRTDYGLPDLPHLSSLFGLAGRTPGHSLSPRLHNAAYRRLGLPALYLPFQVDCLPRFWRAVAGPGLAAAGLALRGVTVTAPHKEDALELAGRASPLARRCGAANVLWDDDGLWRADTTDPPSVLRALAQAGVVPAGRNVAVIGCGGTGRSVAMALRQAGAEVTVVNRGWARGRQAAHLLGLPFIPLSRFYPQGHAVLVHATPLVEREPFPVTDAEPDTVVVEMAYRNPPTSLMAATRARGLRAVDGWEVLLLEVGEQFHLLTGLSMPPGLARSLLPGAGRPVTDVQVTTAN